MLLFRLQLAVTRQAVDRQRSVFDRRHDRASRLRGVPAVAKPAILRDRFDVRERSGHGLSRIPQLELAHSGRIDQNPAARKHHQLAARARVAPPAVALADLARAKALLANQRVRDRRLADAGRAEERCGPAATEVGAEAIY